MCQEIQLPTIVRQAHLLHEQVSCMLCARRDGEDECPLCRTGSGMHGFLRRLLRLPMLWKEQSKYLG